MHARVLNFQEGPAAQQALAGVRFICLVTLCLTRFASSSSALGVGLVLTVGNPFRHLSGVASKYLLQGCVVLLGFGTNLPGVLKVGASDALVAVLTIRVTLLAVGCSGGG